MTYCESLVRNPQSFVLLLRRFSSWGKHDGHSSGLSRGTFIVTSDWLRRLGASQSPLPNRWFWPSCLDGRVHVLLCTDSVHSVLGFCTRRITVGVVNKIKHRLHFLKADCSCVAHWQPWLSSQAKLRFVTFLLVLASLLAAVKTLLYVWVFQSCQSYCIEAIEITTWNHRKQKQSP